ncbi:MAG: glycoside hydrolase family 15 protein, partial [Actinomycetota bacterium]|nr:glycoside hydrolase family 15 protein [Actinomycetota bacterium]
MGYLPIEDHGIIGDLHTAALVGTDGTIDWLCLPAFDSPSVFCSILDDEKGGHFSLRPVEYVHSHQLYLPDTNVLLTRFLSPQGVAEVLDFMPIENGPETRHDLVRDVRVIRGRMTIEVECRPAFDYARQEHTVEFVKGGALFNGADVALNLAGEVPLEEGPANSACARFTLEAGESASFVLHQLKGGEGPREALKRAECQDLLQRTLGYWRRWISKSTYRGRWRDMVNRSALFLKLMVYDPTGALVAAPTMGLPERIGGERNWDYRYTRMRDAAFTMYVLNRVGFEDEAHKFMGWLQDRCQGSGGLLQPLYGIDGRAELREEELPHLSGYRDSRPVRLGNGAYDQLQLDLYGAVLDAAYLHNRYGAPLNYDVWQSLRVIVNWLSENWRQPDAGMWGLRGDRKQFVSSKVLSWVALHRAVRLAHQRGLPSDESRWIEQQDAIYEEVMEKGWNPKKESFVQHYGSDALDASLLLMPVVKFVGPTDPRWLATLERVQKELAYDALVNRYEAAADGSSSGESPFSVCSFWLVECLTRAGRLEEARLALEKMFSYANHLGLYAEEIGPS